MKYVKSRVNSQIRESAEYYLDFFKRNDYENYLNKEFKDDYYESEFILKGIEKFEFSYENEKSHLNDFKNAVNLFEALSFLDESEASDGLLWLSLSLNTKITKYIFNRWGFSTKTIIRRIAIEYGKRGLIFHALARMWWITKLTVLNNEENKYRLTELVFNNPRIIQMFYRNFSNSENIRFAILLALENYINKNGSIETKKLDNFYKYISLIGSVRLLDIVPKEDLVFEFNKYLTDQSET